MRRWILYAAAAAVFLSLPTEEKQDVGDLIPVELLYVSMEGDRIRAETDTEALGYGINMEEALKDMEDTTAGKIFLETADYLIVTNSASFLVPELSGVMRPAAEVCIGVNADGEAAEYMKAHRSEVTLKDIRAGVRDVPVLIRKGGRYSYGGKRKIGEIP